MFFYSINENSFANQIESALGTIFLGPGRKVNVLNMANLPQLGRFQSAVFEFCMYHKLDPAQHIKERGGQKLLLITPQLRKLFVEFVSHKKSDTKVPYKHVVSLLSMYEFVKQVKFIQSPFSEQGRIGVLVLNPDCGLTACDIHARLQKVRFAAVETQGSLRIQYAKLYFSQLLGRTVSVLVFAGDEQQFYSNLEGLKEKLDSSYRKLRILPEQLLRSKSPRRRRSLERGIRIAKENTSDSHPASVIDCSEVLTGADLSTILRSMAVRTGRLLRASSNGLSKIQFLGLTFEKAGDDLFYMRCDTEHQTKILARRLTDRLADLSENKVAIWYRHKSIYLNKAAIEKYKRECAVLVKRSPRISHIPLEKISLFNGKLVYYVYMDASLRISKISAKLNHKLQRLICLSVPLGNRGRILVMTEEQYQDYCRFFDRDPEDLMPGQIDSGRIVDAAIKSGTLTKALVRLPMVFSPQQLIKAKAQLSKIIMDQKTYSFVCHVGMLPCFMRDHMKSRRLQLMLDLHKFLERKHYKLENVVNIFLRHIFRKNIFGLGQFPKKASREDFFSYTQMLVNFLNLYGSFIVGYLPYFKVTEHSSSTTDFSVTISVIAGISHRDRREIPLGKINDRGEFAFIDEDDLLGDHKNLSGAQLRKLQLNFNKAKSRLSLTLIHMLFNEVLYDVAASDKQNQTQAHTDELHAKRLHSQHEQGGKRRLIRNREDSDDEHCVLSDDETFILNESDALLSSDSDDPMSGVETVPDRHQKRRKRKLFSVIESSDSESESQSQEEKQPASPVPTSRRTTRSEKLEIEDIATRMQVYSFDLLMQSLLFSTNIAVAKSSIAEAGSGCYLIASDFDLMLPKGTMVTCFHGRVFHDVDEVDDFDVKRAVTMEHGRSGAHLFSYPVGDKEVPSLVGFGYFVNHSKKSNVYYQTIYSKGVAVGVGVYLKRDTVVPAGQALELFATYANALEHGIDSSLPQATPRPVPQSSLRNVLKGPPPALLPRRVERVAMDPSLFGLSVRKRRQPPQQAQPMAGLVASS